MPASLGKVAVIGGGWAGLSACIEATQLGMAATLFEMAPQLGGRARDVTFDGMALDNGQHICIGAYRETLRMLATVGVDPYKAFLRMPLSLIDARERGLRLPEGNPVIAFLRGVLANRDWRFAEKAALLGATSRWAFAGFHCPPDLTVENLTRSLPDRLRADLIEPLCVAALNTPARSASASVFLRVLHDALFSGRGGSDLLLPRHPLGQILPIPAERWLASQGVDIRLRARVQRIERDERGWRVDDEAFGAVVVAASALECGRLVRSIAPDWADVAEALPYEPIVTVYLRSEGAALAAPMVSMQSDAQRPAQFVFDRGRLGGPAGLLAFVISGAAPWVEAGHAETVAATRRQANDELGSFLGRPLEDVRVITEKRATFRCIPGLRRPPPRIDGRLVAAGDFVDGPYPSTLEGAVRSGVAATRALTAR